MDIGRYPIVRVTWRDAQESEQGWLDIEDCKKTPMALCYTVGWLVEHNDDTIVLMTSAARCMTEEEVTQGGGCTAIPTDWATNIDYLTPVPRKVKSIAEL
tara:strand:- start:2554 stop:2853 length:300 start_codon:yes stop_codon:yes gene_type:complete